PASGNILLLFFHGGLISVSFFTAAIAGLGIRVVKFRILGKALGQVGISQAKLPVGYKVGGCIFKSFYTGWAVVADVREDRPFINFTIKGSNILQMILFIGNIGLWFH